MNDYCAGGQTEPLESSKFEKKSEMASFTIDWKCVINNNQSNFRQNLDPQKRDTRCMGMIYVMFFIDRRRSEAKIRQTVPCELYN